MERFWQFTSQRKAWTVLRFFRCAVLKIRNHICKYLLIPAAHSKIWYERDISDLKRPVFYSITRFSHAEREKGNNRHSPKPRPLPGKCTNYTIAQWFCKKYFKYFWRWHRFRQRLLQVHVSTTQIMLKIWRNIETYWAWQNCFKITPGSCVTV